MRRIFTLVSIAIHSIVLTLVFLAQALNIGALPMPRDVLAYAIPATINPPIPPSPRPPSDVKPADHSATPVTAPVEAPNGVTKETGREGERIERTDPGLVGTVETGGGSDFGVIGGSAIVPPPPPPPVTPTQPVRLRVGIQAPRKIVDAQPEYPVLARNVRQQGIVILDTVIDARGNVESVRVLKGFSLLNQAAIDAVKQWRFTPALLNGQPIPVVMTVTVNFVLTLP